MSAVEPAAVAEIISSEQKGADEIVEQKPDDAPLEDVI